MSWTEWKGSFNNASLINMTIIYYYITLCVKSYLFYFENMYWFYRNVTEIIYYVAYKCARESETMCNMRRA